MKTFLALHVIVYVVANGLLVAVWWMLTRGEGTFWPQWSIALWGGLLALHVGVTLVLGIRRLGRSGRDGADGRSSDPDVSGRPWIAVVFADVVESTRLSEELGDEAWSGMIADFRDRVRGIADDHGGQEVGTQGDGILLRFPSPSAGLEAAKDLQAAFAPDGSGADADPKVRVGVHAGQAVERDDDVLGRMVNVAARVADEAEPGDIVVTEAVMDHVDRDVGFEDLGLRPLKGIEAPRHLLVLRAGS